jgi:precorrin-6Y C5,15-methyltransferase (decarboxylating)
VGDGVISVVGYGGTALPAGAQERLDRAALVVGGRWHLDRLALPETVRTVVLRDDVPGALEQVAQEPGDVVVLASGDPGFFGVLRLVRLLAPDREVEVLPAVSSVARAFAAVGQRWDDAEVVSAHGRDAAPALAVARRARKVAVLTDRTCSPQHVGQALAGRSDRVLVVAERLGLPEQRVTVAAPDEVAGRDDWADPNVVLVLPVDGEERPRSWRAGELQVPPGWALPVDAFAHRGSMISKPEVRALALARLAPRPGEVVWDVGAGSGSVGVECARFGADVHAVERDGEDAERVRENAARHDVPVNVVHGAAPDALAALPEPDAVFVGGGGPEVVAACAARRPARLVVALATLELVAPTVAALAGYDVESVMLQASSLVPLNGGHRLAPANPVFLVCGARAGSRDCHLVDEAADDPGASAGSAEVAVEAPTREGDMP